MEVKFDIVKPNLYMVENQVYFGVDKYDIIQVSRSVDEVIGKHIGVLKVKKADLEAIESGKSKKTEGRYDTLLRKYLDALERKYSQGHVVGVTNDTAKLFSLGYVVAAQTIESGQDINNWRAFQCDLANPNEAFDKYDKDHLVYILDREKTLGEMRKLYKELDPEIPDNCAFLSIVNGMLAYSEHKVEPQYLGAVSFTQLKAKDKTKIEEARDDLVERLKEVDGPCLSFDAPAILRQTTALYNDAPELVQKYGDVLRSPLWKTRLFRLDP